MAQRITDIGILQILSVALIFLFTAFNQTLGILYLLILIVDFIFQQSDKNVTIQFERTVSGRITDIAIALGTFVGFIFIVQLLKGVTSTQSALQLLSQSVPIFEGNVFFQILTFGLFVAVIESIFFFGRLLEAVADNFVPGITGSKVNLFDLTSFGTWLSFTIVSAVFTLVHVQTRAGAEIPLLITFVFAMISCILVSTSKNLRSAVLLHIINNTLVMLVLHKIIFA